MILYLNLAKVNQFLQVHKFFCLLHEQNIAITLVHNLKQTKVEQRFENVSKEESASEYGDSHS